MAYNVLIVDDSETIRAVIRKTLSLTMLPVNVVHEAGNGQAALECMQKHWVDVVFADLNMPVMSGMEMIDYMAERGRLTDTPVIVISTEGSPKRVDELMAKGVRGFIAKPFTPERFKETMEEVLGKETVHE